MKRPKVTGLRRRESWQALPFLLPSLLGLCLFYLFPLAETVRASFMDPLRSRPSGGGTTGRSFKILRSVWLSATPAAFSASASRRCWPSACSVRCCLARQNGGRSF